MEIVRAAALAALNNQRSVVFVFALRKYGVGAEGGHQTCGRRFRMLRICFLMKFGGEHG